MQYAQKYLINETYGQNIEIELINDLNSLLLNFNYEFTHGYYSNYENKK
jgi:hypothetical protein